ncbi:MAG: ATP-dependent DNA helicase [Halobacteria archaeon]
MKLERLGAPSEILEHYRNEGIEELYPPQAEAYKKGVTSGENLVAAVPTASGKTFIAQMAMFCDDSVEDLEGDGESDGQKGDGRTIEESGGLGKSLYVVPLRALASEKFAEFSEIPGVDVGISTGDFDERDESLGENDVIVATSEKADSLIRNGVDWIRDLSTLVVDEVHLLDSGDRGPTLEVTVAKLRKLNPELQVVALSATVDNAEEIAGWLDGKLLSTNWRPVELRRGVYTDGEIVYQDETEKLEVEDDEVTSLVSDSVESGGQCLVFVNSRRSAEAVADRMADEEFRELAELAEDIRDVSDTETGEKLADCIEGGAAFHHAGLTGSQRTLVEEGYRDREVQVICATPTLAAGVNVPARRVVVRDHMRYGDVGMEPIPVLEVQQMFGRAGRPGLDPYGEAVLVAGNTDPDELFETYVEGDPESVYSKLASRQALRSHVLSTVASGFGSSKGELLSFLEGTFYSYQEPEADLSNVVDDVVDYLLEERMLENGDQLEATDLGHQVSRLYVDPQTAARILSHLDEMESMDSVSELSLLEMVCHTTDIYPLYLKKGDKEEMLSYAMRHEDEFVAPPSEFASGFEDWLASLKLVRVLIDWINERSQDEITEAYGIGAGDLNGRVERVDWLLHAATAISVLEGSSFQEDLRNLRIRVAHGVGEELLELVDIRHVGRVRARRLYDEGFRSKTDVENCGVDRLASLLGPKTAVKVLDDLGKEVSLDEVDGSVSVEKEETKQASFGDF